LCDTIEEKIKGAIMRRKLNEDIEVFYEFWEAKKEAKGVVVLVHGMAEHILRYQNFANYLNDSGYHVYGYDQRGHGQTAGALENVGFFAEKDGWSKVVGDVKSMIGFVKENHELPVILMGHSMGSFVSRDFTSQYSHMIDGLILSGTGYKSGLQGQLMIGYGQLEVALRGPRHRSKTIDKITGNVFNAKLKPLRTPFDWLSRDTKEVDKYINDPYCGTVFTSSFYVSLFSAVERVNRLEHVSKIRKDLPVYIFSGDKDPVGSHGTGVKSVYSLMNSAKLSNVSMKLYPEGRHEMLNETNKQEVFNDVHEWLNNII